MPQLLAEISNEEGRVHVNYAYMLRCARRTSQDHPEARILDYGCGGAEVVAQGIDEGLDIYGAEVFYQGPSSRDLVAQKRLPGDRVREIIDDTLDFENGFFDLVLSNQVLEHVVDLDKVLSEIARVTKPGGLFICLFPSKGVIREGHIGVPFSHWFSRGSRMRYYHTLAFRVLGFGFFKDRCPSRAEWTKEMLKGLDTYAHYRPRREIRAAFAEHFDCEFIESDYIRFRLSSSRLRPLSILTRIPLLSALLDELLRELMGMVILSRKRGDSIFG